MKNIVYTSKINENQPKTLPGQAKSMKINKKHCYSKQNQVKLTKNIAKASKINDFLTPGLAAVKPRFSAQV